MEEKKLKNITIRIDPERHQALKIRAAKEGRDISDILRELIGLYLEGKKELIKAPRWS